MTGELSVKKRIGLFIFIFGCGFPAAAMNGFFGALDLPIPIALGVAAIVGLIGGALMCDDPIVAGLVGGFIAGPGGLLAVYFWTTNREEIHSVELLLAQTIGSAPGILAGWGIRQVWGSGPRPKKMKRLRQREEEYADEE